MKAKDTVISPTDISYICVANQQYNPQTLPSYIKVAEAQAEISFKAGIREVVEFIENNSLRATYIADPTKECNGLSDYELAKLKEWGL